MRATILSSIPVRPKKGFEVGRLPYGVGYKLHRSQEGHQTIHVRLGHAGVKSVRHNGVQLRAIRAYATR